MQTRTSVTRDDLKKVVVESGLWNDGREESHGFLLSPDVLRLSPNQVEELESLSRAILGCLAGFGRLAAIAYRADLGYGRSWRWLRSILGAGVPNYYEELVQMHPSQIPLICKVDLLMGTDGKFYIVEIDGHNKHGMGYCILGNRLREASGFNSSGFPGLAKTIADEVKRSSPKAALVNLLAAQEVFYLPESQILLKALRQQGVETALLMQEGRYSCSARLIPDDLPEGLGLYVDLPIMFGNPELVEGLVKLYKEGKVRFLIPPKPFLGSKALLALLRNDEHNPELEAILRSQIREWDLGVIRGHLPETYLISKAQKWDWSSVSGREYFVLKRCVSSGMKGVMFSNDLRFDKTADQARETYNQFIFQKEVENISLPLEYFTQEGELKSDEWFVRLTLFCSRKGVADAVVTARRDKRVHGAIDCLQISVVKDTAETS